MWPVVEYNELLRSGRTRNSFHSLLDALAFCHERAARSRSFCTWTVYGQYPDGPVTVIRGKH